MGLFRNPRSEYYGRRGPAAAIILGAPFQGAPKSVGTVVGDLSTIIGATGASLSVSTASASIENQVNLSGASAAAVVMNGQLATKIRVAGSSLAQSIIAAAIETAIRAIGGTGAQATPTGSLGTLPAALAGSAGAVASAAGSIGADCTFTVGWTAVSGVTGYRVKWGTAHGVYVAQADVDASTFIYAIGGLTEGVTYYVTVFSVVGGYEQTSPVVEISGTPDVPGAPVELTGQAIASAIATAALSTQVRVGGVAAGISTVLGVLSGAALSGPIYVESAPIGTLSSAISTAGIVLSSASASGTLALAPYALVGFAQAQAQGSGDLSVSIRLNGQSLVNALSIAGLTTRMAASGIASAQSQAAGALLATTIPLLGSPGADALASGNLTTVIGLSANAMVESIASGEISFTIPISGFVQSASSAYGSMATRIAVSTSAEGFSRVHGFIGYDDSGGVYGGGVGLPRAQQWWDRLDQLMAEKQKRKKARARRRRRFFY